MSGESFFEHICSSASWPVLRRFVIRDCRLWLMCCRSLAHLVRTRREAGGLAQDQGFEIVTEDFTLIVRNDEGDSSWWEAYGVTVLPGAVVIPFQQDDY